jgi:hypothetical protein
MATKQYGKRDPGSHRTPEQIHAMDHGYKHRPVIVKEREMRNEARAMMRRKLGAKAIEGKDIDHKTPVRANGGHGGNNMANLRVRSRHANRGWDKKC